MILAFAAMIALQGAGRETIGIYENWGAFRETAPGRCFAMAAPVQRRRDAFVAVSNWPGEKVRSQVHVRLSRTRNPRAQVTLSIGDRRFRLVAGPRDAWTSESVSDRAIVAAMRGARSLSVETTDTSGRPFADVYRLGGAATAIDAAGVACAG